VHNLLKVCQHFGRGKQNIRLYMLPASYWFLAWLLEVAFPSAVSLDFQQTTQHCCTPEDRTLHNHCCENPSYSWNCYTKAITYSRVIIVYRSLISSWIVQNYDKRMNFLAAASESLVKVKVKLYWRLMRL
jgi:hypothetical protein